MPRDNFEDISEHGKSRGLHVHVWQPESVMASVVAVCSSNEVLLPKRLWDCLMIPLVTDTFGGLSGRCGMILPFHMKGEDPV